MGGAASFKTDINLKKSLMPNEAAASVKLVETAPKFIGLWTLVGMRGVAGQLPAGVTQLVSHSANTHPVLSRRRPYQPGRLIISAAELSRGHVSARFHSESLPLADRHHLLFWGQLPNALVYFNMTRETDAGCSWAQVQSDKDLTGRQEWVFNPRRALREAKRL